MNIRRIPNKPGELEVWAPAKINTYLKIGPRRGDGYHDLQTVFQDVSLFDRFLFSVAPRDFKLSIHPPILPADRTNLVMKALLLLKKKLKVKKGMTIRLNKNIPTGAGLGGGSSDAAAALWAGWILWKKPRLPNPYFPTEVPNILFDCAKRLGSDVPFFLKGGTAWAEGRGEKLEFFPTGEKRWLLLVYPRAHVSTEKAYRMLDDHRKKSVDFFNSGANSFTPVVGKAFPAIRVALTKLKGLGLKGVEMSGSGSTVFGFLNNASHGLEIKNKLKLQPWDVFVVHTI